MIPTTPDVHDLDTLRDLLTRRGADAKGRTFRCPWHEDRNASGSIFADPDGHWRAKCHACGHSADAIDIAAELAGMDASELLRRTRVSGKPQERRSRQGAIRRWDVLEDATAALALSARGEVVGVYRYEVPGRAHPALVVVRIETGEPDPATGKRSKTFRQVHHDGQGWTAAAPPKPWPLYRQGDLAASRSVVVVEGEKAVEALHAIGIPATTAPCGAGKAEHADWGPLAGKRVVLWPDHDDAGTKHMDQVAMILSGLPTRPECLRRINPAALGLPPKGDAADWIAARGSDVQAVRDACCGLLRAAGEVGPPSPLVALFASIDAEAEGRATLIPWPWPMLTRHARSLLPGKVCVLAGSPGGAKSWLVLASLLHWIGAGIRVAMLALEEQWEWHGRRAMAHLDGNPCLLDGEWVRANPDDARESAGRHGELLDALGRATTCRGNVTLADVAQWIEDRCQAGVRVLVVDPVTLALPGTERNAWDADARFIARAKAAAESSGTSLVLVTHPRKAPAGKSGVFGLDDLAGGAVYQRAAASVLWLENLATPALMPVERPDGSTGLATTHKIVRLIKTRDGAGVGQSIAFAFQALRFGELGRIIDGSDLGPVAARPKRSARIAASPVADEDAFDAAPRAAGDR